VKSAQSVRRKQKVVVRHGESPRKSGDVETRNQLLK